MPDDNTKLSAAVYDYAKRSFGKASSSVDIRAALGRQFPGESHYAVLKSYDNACALLESAFDVGEKVKLDLLKHDQALLFLEQTHTGFSKEIYADALEEGLLKSSR